MLHAHPRAGLRGGMLAVTLVSGTAAIASVTIALMVLAWPPKAPREPAGADRFPPGTLSPSSAYRQVFDGAWRKVMAAEQRRATVCTVYLVRRACSSTLAREQVILRALRRELGRVGVPAQAADATTAFAHQIVAYLRFTSRQSTALAYGHLERFRALARNDAGVQICIGPINEAIESPSSDIQRGDSESLESEAADPIPQLPYANC